jgi:triacylglycerol lipase
MTFFVQLPISSYPDKLPSAFDHGSTFDFATAQAMMWLAQLAYEPDCTIKAILARWQLQPLANLHSPAEGAGADTATQGFVCRRGGTTIVAFAGTDPGKLKTVLTDTELVPDDSSVYPGIRHALDAVWTQMGAAAPFQSGGRLFVTGHSLGAGLAVLAAFRLRATITADAVYTFGLPRVGGTSFGDTYEPILGPRTFRLVNGDDPVPSFPPSFLGYLHVGRSLFCPHAGAFTPLSVPAAALDNMPNFEKVETDAAGHILTDLLNGGGPIPAQPGILGSLYDKLPGGLADHTPAEYLRALRTPVR